MAPVPGCTCGLWAVGCGLGWGSAELTASHLGLTLALLFLTGTQAGTYGQHNLWAERMRRCMIGGLECIRCRTHLHWPFCVRVEGSASGHTVGQH